MKVIVTRSDGDVILSRTLPLSDDDCLRLYCGVIHSNAVLDNVSVSFTVDPSKRSLYNKILSPVIDLWPDFMLAAVGNTVKIMSSCDDKHLYMMVRRYHYNGMCLISLPAPRYSIAKSTLMQLWDIRDIEETCPGDSEGCIEALVDVMNLFKADYIERVLKHE